MQRKKWGNREFFFSLKDNSLPTFKIKGKLQRCYQEKQSCVSPKLKIKYRGVTTIHFKMLYVFFCIPAQITSGQNTEPYQKITLSKMMLLLMLTSTTVAALHSI